MLKYNYPFANQQLNSYIGATTHAAGRPDYRISLKPYLNMVKWLYVIDDKQLLLDMKFSTIMVENKKITRRWKKDESSFTLMEDGGVISFSGSSVSFRKLGDPDAEKTDRWYASLKEKPALIFFRKTGEFIISGMNILHAPEEPPSGDHFYMVKKKLGTAAAQFEKDLYLDRMIPWPVLTPDEKIVLCYKNTLKILNFDFQVEKEPELPGAGKILSAGADGNLYCYTQGSGIKETFLTAFDTSGKKLWQHSSGISVLYHPPVVSRKSRVYLIGSGKIEAFYNGSFVWEYPLGTSPDSQKAVVLDDETLLVADDNRIVHLNEFGEPLWIYTDKKELPFKTQPVLSPSGKIFAATDQEIVCIK